VHGGACQGPFHADSPDNRTQRRRQSWKEKLKVVFQMVRWMGDVSHAVSAKCGEVYRKIFGDDRRPFTLFLLIPSDILANKNVI
jgi:hypothetical protein